MKLTPESSSKDAIKKCPPHLDVGLIQLIAQFVKTGKALHKKWQYNIMLHICAHASHRNEAYTVPYVMTFFISRT